LAIPLALLLDSPLKACVSAHGGDQYLPHQVDAIAYFFSIFYVSINVGATLSGFITSFIKEKVKW
jgi:dipeptide/tripeptide permease